MDKSSEEITLDKATEILREEGAIIITVGIQDHHQDQEQLVEEILKQGQDHQNDMMRGINKKVHGLKAQPLKDFILGSSPSVNRELLTHIVTNVNTHPATQNF